jgi:hypothetical protein
VTRPPAPRWPNDPVGSAPRGWPVLLVAALALGCAVAPRPAAAPPAGPRVPIVLVPGATGTELIDAATGAVAWGTGPRLLLPRDRGRALALPLGGGPAVAIPGRVLAEMRLFGVVRKPIYRPVVESFVAAGWVAGDLAAPQPGDTFFTFAYDWRRDAVRSAGELVAGLERLRAARGEERLEVDLICQSSGSHVCRYLARYGAASLGDAEAGRGGLPPTLGIRRLVLVGASNGGSVRIFAMLHRGRRYLPGGRFFAPETLFTFESFYQDLPAGSGAIFVDPEGEPLPANLYEPGDWVRHGWSVFDPELARRLDAGRRGGELGDPAARLAFLGRQLAAARRFQAVLARDAPVGPTRYFLVQEATTPTMVGAVLKRGTGKAAGRWRTWFPGDRRVERRPALTRRLTEIGDGHATLASQGFLSPREHAALGAAPLRAAGGHFEMINAPGTLRWLVTVLGQPAPGSEGTSPMVGWR